MSAGIGQVKARRLYDRFGPDLADLIEDRDLEALTQIISAEAAELLCNAFDKFKVANALLWLDRAGITLDTAAVTAAILAHRAAEKTTAKNLLVPKPKPEADVHKPGQRQRKPMPARKRKV